MNEDLALQELDETELYNIFGGDSFDIINPIIEFISGLFKN
jgi:hypothetical protein